jgi:hypothetical protein
MDKFQSSALGGMLGMLGFGIATAYDALGLWGIVRSAVCIETSCRRCL